MEKKTIRVPNHHARTPDEENTSSSMFFVVCADTVCEAFLRTPPPAQNGFPTSFLCCSHEALRTGHLSEDSVWFLEPSSYGIPSVRGLCNTAVEGPSFLADFIDKSGRAKESTRVGATLPGHASQGHVLFGLIQELAPR